MQKLYYEVWMRDGCQDVTNGQPVEYGTPSDHVYDGIYKEDRIEMMATLTLYNHHMKHHGKDGKLKRDIEEKEIAYLRNLYPEFYKKLDQAENCRKMLDIGDCCGCKNDLCQYSGINNI